MANMSYCRWQNTLSDLRDCAADLKARMSDLEYLDEEDRQARLSDDERRAMLAVLDLCAEMLQQAGAEANTDYDLPTLKVL